MLYIILFFVPLVLIVYFFESKIRKTKNIQLISEYNTKCVSYIMSVAVIIMIVSVSIGVVTFKKTVYGNERSYYDEVFIPNIMNGDTNASIQLVQNDNKTCYHFILNDNDVYIPLDSCEVKVSSDPRVERRFLEKFKYWKDMDETKKKKLHIWFLLGWDYERIFETYVVYVPSDTKLTMKYEAQPTSAQEYVNKPIVNKDTSRVVKVDVVEEPIIEEQVNAPDTL